MPRVRVRLHTRGVRLEFQGDQALYERYIQPLILGSARGGGRAARDRADEVSKARPPIAPAKGAEEGPAKVGYTPPSQDFGTFCRQLAPSENGPANRIAAFAFFLWNYERKDVFLEEEVRGCFRAEGAELPSDDATLYEDLVSRRILQPAEARGTWRLTSKGKSHVRHHLLSA